MSCHFIAFDVIQPVEPARSKRIRYSNWTRQDDEELSLQIIMGRAYPRGIQVKNRPCSSIVSRKQKLFEKMSKTLDGSFCMRELKKASLLLHCSVFLALEQPIAALQQVLEGREYVARADLLPYKAQIASEIEKSKYQMHYVYSFCQLANANYPQGFAAYYLSQQLGAEMSQIIGDIILWLVD